MNDSSLFVVCRHHPEATEWDSENEPILDPISIRNDQLDEFNHPRYRRVMILEEIYKRSKCRNVNFDCPLEPAANLDLYQKIHSNRLINFFLNSWKRWDELGADGQDPMCNGGGGDNTISPALIPGNVPLPRDPYQRPSQNVMGQMGFYCTDDCTPIFSTLVEELLWDAAVLERAVDLLERSRVIYALGTHPGHHTAKDSFGGYCYLNHAAMAARLLQQRKLYPKVAILDVDYHCGNGTASIFYEDPSVLMISIHCHPDFEYPFHSGFHDEIGFGEGKDTTLHLPLMPGTTWQTYRDDLQTALDRIQSFGAEALVVSLGLDTYRGDPCAIRRAGFLLQDKDYISMGKMISTTGLPILVVQEGGYKMDSVPQAAADVLFGLTNTMSE